MSAKTIQSFELSPIKAIELAASRIPGAVSLAQGIPSFETPRAIRDFIIEKIREGACDKYSLTTGLPELRQAISSSLCADGLSYDAHDEIIVTAGSIEAISASILSCTSPGDEVVLPSPSYTSYLGAISIARCVPRFVELDEDRNFSFHIDRMERAITPRTKVILYCSPNNPTGTIFSAENSRAIAALAAKHNLVLLIDEVYKDFYYSEQPHFTPASIPEMREHVIRVCSFSKAFAMTGWRVGFVHAARTRIREILKYHDAMVTCAPVASQYGALAALRFGEQYLREFRERFKVRRDYTIAALDRLSFALDYQMPMASYFVFPRVKDTVPLARDSTALAYDILERAHVAVVPGVAFGPSGESHLRISFGRDEKDLSDGLERLAEYLNQSNRNRRTSQTAAASSAVKLRSQTAAQLLSWCAGKYIRRNRPLVIGIAGILGKTTFKRILVDELSSLRPCRGSRLSHNTPVGMALSVLDLDLGKGRFFQAKNVSRAIARGLLARENAEMLVLEYGIRRPDDVTQLLKIATPDWLVLTPLGPDDFSEYNDTCSGITRLVECLPKDRILWSNDGSNYAARISGLSPGLGFSGADNHLRSEVATRENAPRPSLVGQSAVLAQSAADLLKRILTSSTTAK